MAGNHEPSLARSGIDATGMIALIPFGTMGAMTNGAQVLQHGKGNAHFTYTPPAVSTRSSVRILGERGIDLPNLHALARGWYPSRGAATDGAVSQ